MSLALPQQPSLPNRIQSAIPNPLVAILLIALVLRVIFIDSRGLWGDEAYRVIGARLPTFLDTLRVPIAQPPSAPFYYLSLHFWINLFGHSDVAVRLLSIPASLATLIPTCALGRMAGGRATALLAAALLAIAPFAIETGQEANHYAWAAFFATCTMWSALSWLTTGRGAPIFVLSGALLLYAHYMGALIMLELLVAGLVWMARSHPGASRLVRRLDWLKAHALIALIWSPWAITMFVRLLDRSAEFSQLHQRAGLPELYGSLANMGLATSAAVIWPAWQTNIALLAGGFLVLLALLLPRPRPQRHIAQTLAALSAAFVLAIVGISATTGVWLIQTRFFTMMLPVALVVVAAGVPVGLLRVSRARHAPLLWLGTLLLGVWLLFQLNAVRSFYVQPVHGRDGVREAAAWLNAEREPGDFVAANNALLVWSLTQYHDGPMQGLPENIDPRDGYNLLPPSADSTIAIAQWKALASQTTSAQRLWLIYLPVMDQQGALLQEINQRYTLTEHRHYQFADVYLFVRTED